MNRRTIVKLIVGGASASVLAACGVTPQAPAPPTAPTAAANPKVAAAQYTGMASWYSAVETPDKYTAIFKSDIPRPTIFDLLEFLNICDKDSLEGPDAKNTAVGTGPFKFVEWVPGDHITLTKNP